MAIVRVPPELLERILELAGIDMILVGGQALAFWAAYYRTPAPAIAITKDVDLLGTKADVERLARGLDAKAVFPHKIATTILVGQVLKDLPGGDYVNIDVMFRVYGNIATEAMRARLGDRITGNENPAGRFRVMHPIDVLQGRLENVYGLSAKQDEHGVAQLRLAIEVARSFVGDMPCNFAGAGADAPARGLWCSATWLASRPWRCPTPVARWPSGLACTWRMRLIRNPPENRILRQQEASGRNC